MDILFVNFSNKISPTMEKVIDVLSDYYHLTLLMISYKDMIKNEVNSKKYDIKYIKINRLNKYFYDIENKIKLINYIKKNKYDLVILHHSFLFASLVRIFCNSQKILYIHGHVTVGKLSAKRIYCDLHKWINAKLFKYQLVVNYSIIKYFNPANNKYRLIPAILERKSKTIKNFEKLDLLYVGSLNLRNVEKTIYGFKIFCDKYWNVIPIKYYIIGDGNMESINTIRNAIVDCSLESIVEYKGYLNDEDVKHYFDSCNVGVAFIPVTDYFFHNTSNKFYEYLLSGMVTIATALEANIQTINEMNGVIIDDSEDGFFQGLEHIYKNLNKYNSKSISESVSQNEVVNVTKEHIIPYINSILGLK